VSVIVWTEFFGQCTVVKGVKSEQSTREMFDFFFYSPFTYVY
jgi:hypothetical protein